MPKREIGVMESSRKKNITYMELRESGLVARTRPRALAPFASAIAVLDHLRKTTKTEKKAKKNLNECKKINIGPYNKARKKKYKINSIYRYSLEKYGKVTALTLSPAVAQWRLVINKT